MSFVFQNGKLVHNPKMDHSKYRDQVRETIDRGDGATCLGVLKRLMAIEEPDEDQSIRLAILKDELLSSKLI